MVQHDAKAIPVPGVSVALRYSRLAVVRWGPAQARHTRHAPASTALPPVHPRAAALPCSVWPAASEGFAIVHRSAAAGSQAT